MTSFFANSRITASEGIRPRQHDGAGFGRGEQLALAHGEMMQQIDLVLGQIRVRHPEAAQWPEAGVDAVNGAWLRGERFHQLAAALDERPGFRGNLARGAMNGDLPGFENGEVVPVQ